MQTQLYLAVEFIAPNGDLGSTNREPVSAKHIDDFGARQAVTYYTEHLAVGTVQGQQLGDRLTDVPRCAAQESYVGSLVFRKRWPTTCPDIGRSCSNRTAMTFNRFELNTRHFRNCAEGV